MDPWTWASDQPSPALACAEARIGDSPAPGIGSYVNASNPRVYKRPAIGVSRLDGRPESAMMSGVHAIKRFGRIN